MGHHTHPFIKPFLLSPAPHKQTCGRCHTRQEGGRQIVPRLMYGSVCWLFAPRPAASRSVSHPHSLQISRNVQTQAGANCKRKRETYGERGGVPGWGEGGEEHVESVHWGDVPSHGPATSCCMRTGKREGAQIGGAGEVRDMREGG